VPWFTPQARITLPGMSTKTGELQIVVFWLLRLAIQPLVFDSLMRSGWTKSWVIRGGSILLWTAYAAVYGFTFLVQLGYLEAPR
jgi:hypothetical protein